MRIAAAVLLLFGMLFSPPVQAQSRHSLGTDPGVVADPPPDDVFGASAPIARSPGAVMMGPEDDLVVPPTEIAGGDNPYPLGTIVTLSVRPIFSRPKELHSVVYVWRITPRLGDLQPTPDNTSVSFGTGIVSTTVRVELIACYLFLWKDAKSGQAQIIQKVGVAEKLVTLGGGPAPGPAPGPGPVPPPGPAPTPLSGLAQEAYDWLNLVTLDVAARRANAMGAAANFRDVARRIDASISATAAGVGNAEFKTLNQVMAATRQANDVTLAATAKQWLPWFQRLDARLKAMIAARQFNTLEQCRDAWVELAKGLEAGGR